MNTAKTPEERQQAVQGDEIALAIPKWFMIVSSTMIALTLATLVPWFMWNTAAVMKLEAQAGTLSKFVDKLDVLLSMSTKLDGLSRRIDLMEDEVRNVRNTRWSKLDHEKQTEPKLKDHESRLRDLERRQ